MAKNHAGGIILDAAKRDESLADAPLTGFRHLVLLKIDRDGRRGVANDTSVANPLFKRLSCARVDIVSRLIIRQRFTLLDWNQIVGTRCRIFFRHRRRNLVVRLSQNLRRIHAGCIVPIRSKWKNLRHPHFLLLRKNIRSIDLVRTRFRHEGLAPNVQELLSMMESSHYITIKDSWGPLKIQWEKKHPAFPKFAR